MVGSRTRRGGGGVEGERVGVGGYKLIIFCHPPPPHFFLRNVTVLKKRDGGGSDL